MAKVFPFSNSVDGHSVEHRGTKSELVIAASTMHSELYFAIIGARNALLHSEPEAVRSAEQAAFQAATIAAQAIAETVAPVVSITEAPSYQTPQTEIAAVEQSPADDANAIDLYAPDVPLAILDEMRERVNDIHNEQQDNRREAA
jgi:hypothetical protein